MTIGLHVHDMSYKGENRMQVMTQLAFKSQYREAFEFYEKVLGGKVAVMNTFGGRVMPSCRAALRHLHLITFDSPRCKWVTMPFWVTMFLRRSTGNCRVLKSLCT